MKNKRKIFLIFFSTFSISLFSQVYSGRQLLESDHWIYNALYDLNLEQKRATLLDNAPLSVDELYMNFLQIDETPLSKSGKSLYESVENFFLRKKFLLDFGSAKFTTNVLVNPVGVLRTNKDLSWSYAESYTKDSDNYVSTDLMCSIYSSPVLTFPFIADFAETAYINVEPYAGAGAFWALSTDNYALNIPMGNNGAEFFMWPLNAQANIGHSFSDWGLELSCGRGGLEIGRTKTGSVIYNSSFQSDYYFQLNLFSPRVKYNMDIAQIDYSRFLYVHSASLVPFTWLKIGVVEGTLVDGPFELRYLNPLIFMHSFSGWRQYASEDEEKYYDEAHYCAYFAFSFDINPCPYLRIYGLYSQNEIQSSVELNGDLDYCYPDSLAFQLGSELSLPVNILGGGYLKFALEGIYTTPFMYLKSTKNASLMRIRNYDDSAANRLGKVATWLGSPFGPDAAGGQFSASFEKAKKWKIDFSYLFLAHGTNSFSLFDKTYNIGGIEYESFYPAAIYLQHQDDVNFNCQELKSSARSYALTKEVSYTNSLSLEGQYYFLDNLSLTAGVTYTFVFNHKAKSGLFAHGGEFLLGAKYSLF